MGTRSGLRRAGAASVTALLAGGLAVAIASGAGPAGATGNVANGPTYPAPGGQTFTRSGNSVDPGGVTYNFSGFDLTAFSQIAWGLDLANGPVVLSMEGGTAPSDNLTYNSTLSNLAAGQLVFTGSTSVTGVFYSGPVAPRRARRRSRTRVRCRSRPSTPRSRDRRAQSVESCRCPATGPETTNCTPTCNSWPERH
jgi:hypothetical protein